MLIHGDNLLALKALEKDYSNKIKCIYIDPPYNTGAAFEHYDDNLEHSIWLNLMRQRIEILYNLLSDEGIIFIQIDDNEQAYLKVMMDEIFGRSNFVNCITVKMSEASGTKMAHVKKRLPKLKEFLLMYKKDKIELNDVKIPKDIWDNEYNKILLNFSKSDKELVDRLNSNCYSNNDEFLLDLTRLSNVLEEVQTSSANEEMKKMVLISKIVKKFLNGERVILIEFTELLLQLLFFL